MQFSRNYSLYVLFQFSTFRRSLNFVSSQNDDDEPSLATSPQVSSSHTISYIHCKSQDFPERCGTLQKHGKVYRTFHYRKKKSYENNGIFTAPAGVNPHHVTSSIVRRNTGGSRLIFVWPQKTGTRSRMVSVLIPLVRGLLISLLGLDAIHLWPGEFLPKSLPNSTPFLQPPIKCNVIEPRWFDTT